MTNEEKATFLEGAKNAFFEAMLDGYAGGENKRSIKTKDEDGYVTITYETEDGKYKVVDRYCTTPLSDKSAGTTTIFLRTGLIWSPAWWMAYGGEYPKKVIPFLKKSLYQTYEGEDFVGGRGRKVIIGSEMEYLNRLEIDCGFEEFSGVERIYPREEDVENQLGHHRYFGMGLI